MASLCLQQLNRHISLLQNKFYRHGHKIPPPHPHTHTPVHTHREKRKEKKKKIYWYTHIMTTDIHELIHTLTHVRAHTHTPTPTHTEKKEKKKEEDILVHIHYDYRHTCTHPHTHPYPHTHPPTYMQSLSVQLCLATHCHKTVSLQLTCISKFPQVYLSRWWHSCQLNLRQTVSHPWRMPHRKLSPCGPSMAAPLCHHWHHTPAPCFLLRRSAGCHQAWNTCPKHCWGKKEW